jgi:hypothetical protein
VAALDHGHGAFDHGGEVFGPVAERRQAGASRQGEAQGADPGEPAPLHHGVDEVRGADHDGVDRPPAHRARRREARQRVEDAARHVGRRRCLDGARDLAVLDQHRIGVGAADVDANAPHGNTAR